jgi:hypothetical protein
MPEAPRFHVRVLRLDRIKAEVDLRLTIIHPDQRAFDDTRTFAVLLLDRRGLTLEEVKKTERKLVKKVALGDVRNFPMKLDGLAYTEAEWATFWSRRELLPQATLSIVAKDPKLLAYLEVGQEWESEVVAPT